MRQKQKEEILNFLYGLLPALTLEYDWDLASHAFKSLDLALLPLPKKVQDVLHEYAIFNISDLFLQCAWGLNRDLDDLKEIVNQAYAKLKEYFTESPQEGIPPQEV